jgi:hypothetical protein
MFGFYFWLLTAVILFNACCYAQFKVPLSWELSVAVYPELVEGSLTCTFKSYSAILSSDTLITTLLRQAKLKPFRKKQNQSFRFLHASYSE